jgi:hypothetical protein
VVTASRSRLFDFVAVAVRLKLYPTMKLYAGDS